MRTHITPEILTNEQIANWYRSTAKGFRHMLTRCNALGLAAGPSYRQPSDEEIHTARQHICASINARKQ